MALLGYNAPWDRRPWPSVNESVRGRRETRVSSVRCEAIVETHRKVDRASPRIGGGVGCIATERSTKGLVTSRGHFSEESFIFLIIEPSRALSYTLHICPTVEKVVHAILSIKLPKKFLLATRGAVRVAGIARLSLGRKKFPGSAENRSISRATWRRH